LFVEANTDDPTDARQILEVDGEDQSLESQDAPKVGDPVPELQIEYLGPEGEGMSGNLADYSGTPTVINFWSSTCAPCLSEMPDLEQVSQEMGDQVQFLGIDVTDSVETGQKMVERTGVTYPNARDPRAEIMGALGGTALPRTMLVSADRVVLATHNGAITAEDLTEMIDESGMLEK
jgi:thiol-disulfide isomerase/thioredoxin